MSDNHQPVIRVHDDAVPEDLMLDLMEFINASGWKYGWHSDGKLQYCHFNQKYAYSKKTRIDVGQDLPAPVEAVRRHLESTILAGMTLIGAYANGYVYGTDGYPHRDSKHPDDRTIVVYGNPEWKPGWGGETVFFDKAGDVAKAVTPRWRRAVVFPSNILHAARTVSRDCVMMRVVMVYKYRVGIPDGQG